MKSPIRGALTAELQECRRVAREPAIATSTSYISFAPVNVPAAATSTTATASNVASADVPISTPVASVVI